MAPRVQTAILARNVCLYASKRLNLNSTILSDHKEHLTRLCNACATASLEEAQSQ